MRMMIICLSFMFFNSQPLAGSKEMSFKELNHKDEAGVQAISCDTFLSSLGVNTHVSQGYNPVSYIKPLRYLGIRNIRDSERNLSGEIMLHEETGVLIDLLGADVTGLVSAAKNLAKAHALLSIEGPNEPNNFLVNYKDQQGGGTSGSWLPVAQLQRDLYSAVQTDPVLKSYPVFHVSEGGAETDNVGLQFLTIPTGAGTLFPDGTRFADFANPHNYVSGVRSGYVDNQAWQAADPTLNSRWDGLYAEYGRTWKKHFRGYSEDELKELPRVTTETGWDAANIEEERTQGIVLVNTYLAQFRLGWRYTFIYELGEGEGGGGNQGLFHKDWTPKNAADFIHNLTNILTDDNTKNKRHMLMYSIDKHSDTVHDLLLEKANGSFELIIWGESVFGINDIKVNFNNSIKYAKLYDTTIGVYPIAKFTDSFQIPMRITDHAMILEID